MGGLRISRWVFDAEELRNWRVARNHHLSDWFTVEVAAKVLGAHPEVVSWLIKSGFLKAQRVPNMRGYSSRIHRTEVDRFRTCCVFAVEIADRLRMQSRELKTLLASHQVFPLEMPDGKPCRQLIYGRTDKLDEIVRRTLKLRMDAGILETDLEP